MPTPTCGAANPTPGAASIVARILTMRSWNSAVPRLDGSTGSAGRRSTGSPHWTISRRFGLLMTGLPVDRTRSFGPTCGGAPRHRSDGGRTPQLVPSERDRSMADLGAISGGGERNGPTSETRPPRVVRSNGQRALSAHNVQFEPACWWCGTAAGETGRGGSASRDPRRAMTRPSSRRPVLGPRGRASGIAPRLWLVFLIQGPTGRHDVDRPLGPGNDHLARFEHEWLAIVLAHDRGAIDGVDTELDHVVGRPFGRLSELHDEAEKYRSQGARAL